MSTSSRHPAFGPAMSKGLRLALIGQFGALAMCPAETTAQMAGCGPLTGTFTTGIFCAPGIGVPASLSTAAGTSLATPTGASLRATARNAEASVTINGTVIANANAGTASGLMAQVTSGLGNASVTFDGGTSTVTMAGTGFDAVAVSNSTAGTSTITVAAGTRLDITNPLTGNERDGLDINANQGGSASLVHNGTGQIATAGGNAIWVKTVGTGSIDMTVGAGNTLRVDNTDTVSGSSNHAGLHARSTGSGTIAVTSAATLESTGRNGMGIYTEAATGNTTVVNTGGITTTGLNGFGIRATANGGSVDIRNAGAIVTTGGGGHGLYVSGPLGAGGSISIHNDGTLAVGSTADLTGSRGIYLIAQAESDVAVTGSGDITVQGDAATTRGQGIIASAVQGDVRIEYGGGITVAGAGAGGIRADSAQGNVQVTYTGRGIETFNSQANGIYATTTSATGSVGIAAQGAIVTHSNLAGGGDGTGSASFGLQGLSLGGDVAVAFTGPRIDVNGSGAAILAANAYGGTGLGSIVVANDGEVLARGDRQQGIHTRSVTGTQTLTNRGSIETRGASASQGILAEALGAASITVTNSGAITTRGDNASGIDVRTQGGSVDIRNAQDIRAGWGSSAAVSMGGTSQVLRNSATLDALSDVAVRADVAGLGGTEDITLQPIDLDPPFPVGAVPSPTPQPPPAAPSPATLQITNGGEMTGVVSASTSAVRLDNTGTWRLRSFTDSSGSGIRDRWGVAVSRLGNSGSNSIANTGTLVLERQPASGIVAFDAAGAYLPFGRAGNTPETGGPVQGQILGVGTFTHGGTIDLTGGGSAVGNVLVIGGGGTAGQNGNGVFVSNGGTLRLNAVLNDGGANSRSDALVVDSTRTGAGGATRLQVNNVGGTGALTQGNGIAVVEILDKSPTASAPDAFVLDGRAVAGAYEYKLFRGADDGSGVDAWYLRSQQEPDPPLPPDPPPVPDLPPLYRPEVAAYLANQRLAGQMFVHSLHDRLGEPQYVEGQGFDGRDDRPRSGWLRLVGRWEGSRTEDDVFKVSTRAFLLHGGAEFARWRLGSETDRLHMGAMASYGEARSDARAEGNGARAEGKVDGFSVGLYSTWYQNDEHKLGAYVDGWLQYGWFRNQVKGDHLANVKYDANGLGVSAEAGYAFPLPKEWVAEPQAQVIFVDYREDDITEPNGTRVSGGDADGLVTRLGVRVHRTFPRDDGRKLQLFGTLNWWHSDTESRMSFNRTFVGGLYPATRFELKLGVHADLRRGWTGWSNVSASTGDQDYYQYTLRFGAKRTW